MFKQFQALIQTVFSEVEKFAHFNFKLLGETAGCSCKAFKLCILTKLSKIELFTDSFVIYFYELIKKLCVLFIFSFAH